MSKWIPNFTKPTGWTLYNLDRYAKIQVVCQEDGSGRFQGEYEKNATGDNPDILITHPDCDKLKEIMKPLFSELTKW